MTLNTDSWTSMTFFIIMDDNDIFHFEHRFMDNMQLGGVDQVPALSGKTLRCDMTMIMIMIFKYISFIMIIIRYTNNPFYSGMSNLGGLKAERVIS